MTTQTNLIDACREFLAAIVEEQVEKALVKHGSKITPALLNSQQAADFLALPQTWVEKAARDGKLKSVKLGTYVRFRIEDLKELIQQEQK